MPISRLFRLLYILLERERVPAPELAQTLEVSVRTIYRDVQTLGEAGIPVYAERGRDGGVAILACQAVSRKVSDLFDEADPIEGSYTFEVSSAGAERPLKRPSDFQRFLGHPVLVKTYKPKDGRKEFAGTLAGYDNGAVLLDMGGAEPLRFEKPELALVRLRVEF